MFIYELVLLFVGMMIGWNFLPQPLWAKNLWSKLFNKSTTEE
jgi:hypothetical protein